MQKQDVYWHDNGRIGSLLGVRICADECTTRQLRVSFARVLIEIDVTKPMPNSVLVESPSKELLELKVVYEWTPRFCSKCNKVGHDCSTKPVPAKPKQVHKQPALVAPKQKQAWVPKPSQAAAPVVDVGASVHGQSVITPQVHISQNSDEGWRIVGRKTKSQQTRVHTPASTSNAFMALFANEMDGAVDVIGLLETKIKLKNVLTYQRKFGSSWLWMCNYDHSPKGRISLGWNADRVTFNVLKIQEHFIHCSVSSKDLSTQIHLIVVYRRHSIHERLPTWEGIRSISIQHSPWFCASDFNFVLHTLGRLHGIDVTNYETRDFQSLVDYLDLTEELNSVKSSIKSLNSKQFGNIKEKIDQANVELAGIQNLMAQNPDDLDLYAKESDAIKTRRNRIDSIFDSNQVLLKDPDVISHEIISFYKSLLGTHAPWLPAVDLVTMRRGKYLSSVA
ncbi:uncharacterized protein LOC110715207 [Chenopodium quinoa]|uniref:uncharacterized protein LOC110715207 n=1 Tax=Chenopodium quinoa TaxID=63459 RepID=UPI000B76F578|nr:uncharacterized protein LOC110715207 [Chenopodium quinoa]